MSMLNECMFSIRFSDAVILAVHISVLCGMFKVIRTYREQKRFQRDTKTAIRYAINDGVKGTIGAAAYGAVCIVVAFTM